MRLKLNKRIFILIGAVLILILMLAQIIASVILQVIKPYEEKKKSLEQEIISYELPFDQENELIAQGITILKFYHSVNCLECLDQKNFLEFLVNQYKGQFVLEELQSNQATVPSLKILSVRDTVTLNNATNYEIVDKLCDLMLQPPIEFRCALRNV